jgi:hypothetical protein
MNDTCMNGMSRREFGKLMGMGTLVLSIGASVFTAGCSIVSDIANWGPLGLTAFNTIITLLETAGFIPAAAIVAVVRAAFAQLIADCKQYEAIQPPPVGLLAEIRAAFVIIVSNFQNILSSLAAPIGPFLTLIVGLAQVVFDTIAGFESQLGPAPAGQALVPGRVQVGQRTIQVTPTLRSRRAFKHVWNSVCAASGYPNAEMPVSFWERF